MKRLQQLFNGRLTTYQIATATGIDIELVEKLLKNEMTLDELDPAIFTLLYELEESLFYTEVTKSTQKDETSA